jgi:hypothetical protein
VDPKSLDISKEIEKDVEWYWLEAILEQVILLKLYADFVKRNLPNPRNH